MFFSPFELVSLNVGGSTIESSSCEKLLGIFIDSNFAFEYHINWIYRKTSQKLNALSTISKYISGDEKRLLFKSFIVSQFNYCPLVWMCHSRGLNKKINNLPERALRIVDQYKKSKFWNFAETWQVCINLYKKNLQYLGNETLKFKNEHCPEIMKKIFIFMKI